jgi:chemotaxis family two-component system response regulator Rcp1
MEILLVEDSLMDARLTIGMLKKGNFRHRTTLVRDGLEAMAFLNRDAIFANAPQPDLILLDLEMPQMDGRQVLVELDQHAAFRAIPVVVLTSSNAPEDREIGTSYQVDGYLLKPVNVDQFVALIQRLKRFWHSDLMLPAVD